MTQLAKLANEYRRAYPYMPFSVRRVKCDSAHLAYCTKKGDKFVIAIDKSLPECVAMFLMPHEISHAVAFHDSEDHGNAFWNAYQKNYEIYETFCSRKGKDV